MFLLHPLPGEFFFFNRKWMLNFIKSFFYSYEDNHIVFNLQFVNVVYHTDSHADTEKSSPPWNKSHLIMVYEPFNELLDSV